MNQDSQSACDSPIIFFDDFTFRELDRSKWNVEITGNIVNNEQQAYIDSPETIYLVNDDYESAHGVLVIQPRYKKDYVTSQGNRFDFVSGRINTQTKIEFTYGSISARISLPAETGLWTAFWVLGVSGQWPRCGELDIMENVGEPEWTSVAIHGPGYFGETPLVNKKYYSLSNDASKWHIYSLDLMPDRLLFRVDGEIIYRATCEMIKFYGDWVFDKKKFLILNFALGGTYPFKTNGIRFPYYGIPDTTVKSIQNNEIKMLVDWVKVTTI
jgi:beta-glucanase (GH16 family)